MGNWWEIALVFLLSTIKFVFGGIPLALSFGFSYFQTVTVTTLGGFFSICVFVYLSDRLIAYFKARSLLKRSKNPNIPRKKIFTRKNRVIISVKTRFGILGFAILVPFFIPIPLGCFLTIRYFKDKQLVMRYLFGSVFFWSLAASILYKPLIDAIRTYFL